MEVDDNVQFNAAMLHDKHIVIDLKDISPTAPIAEGLASLHETIVRVNQLRPRGRLVPKRITIELGVPDLSTEEKQILHQAQRTNYKRVRPFQTPAEVRMYFRPDVMEHTGTGGIDEATLNAMAEVVIKSRSNCEF